MKLYDQNIWGNFGVNDAVGNRKYLVNEMVREQDADICCFQECNPGTMRAGKDSIQNLLSDKYIEICIDKANVNFTPVFIRKDKFDVIEEGYLPYPGLNDINSKSVTYAVLREKKSGKVFTAASTHFWWEFGKESDEQRIENAIELKKLAKKFAEKYDAPFLVSGDFNSGYADTCPYNAVKLYLDDKENGWFRTTCTKLQDPTDEDVKKAISETQYGKCVFECDNDVVDHQVVNMLFEDDITVSFTMNPFGKDGRYIHIMGTGGEIHAALAGDTPIKCYNYLTDEETVIPLVGKDGIAGGHGGGDEGIVKTLYSYLNGEYNGDCIPDIEESCYNHMIVFAAEESRLMGKTVDIDEFLKKVSCRDQYYCYL